MKNFRDIDREFYEPKSSLPRSAWKGKPVSQGIGDWIKASEFDPLICPTCGGKGVYTLETSKGRTRMKVCPCQQS